MTIIVVKVECLLAVEHFLKLMYLLMTFVTRIFYLIVLIICF